MTNDKDRKAIHEIIGEWCGEGTIGVMRRKIAEYLDTARKEARATAFRDMRTLIEAVNPRLTFGSANGSIMKKCILSELEAATEGDAHPEDFCHKCGRPNIVWFAPNPLWNKAVREANQPEILCPVCFVQLAEASGVSAVWEVAPQHYHAEETQKSVMQAFSVIDKALIGTGPSGEAARNAAREIAHEINGGDRADCRYPEPLIAILDDPSIANEKALADWALTIISKYFPTAVTAAPPLVANIAEPKSESEPICVHCGRDIEKSEYGPPINSISWSHIHNGVVWCQWPAPCSWTYDPDGYWQTACGDHFCITQGTPAENRMRYCHYCGRQIVEPANNEKPK